jgi:hypothetical protein
MSALTMRLRGPIPKRGAPAAPVAVQRRRSSQVDPMPFSMRSWGSSTTHTTPLQPTGLSHWPARAQLASARSASTADGPRSLGAQPAGVVPRLTSHLGQASVAHSTQHGRRVIERTACTEPGSSAPTPYRCRSTRSGCWQKLRTDYSAPRAWPDTPPDQEPQRTRHPPRPSSPHP